jgi:hypothetical protein
MARAADVNDVQVPQTDYTVEMGINEIESGRGPPMTEQSRFDVLTLKRFPE